jgi:hypothetical protein
MDASELRTLLEKLRAEVKSSRALETSDRAVIQSLLEDIEAELGPAAEPTASPSLLDRLNHTIQHYEVSHPHLTLILSQVLNTLSQAGV